VRNSSTAVPQHSAIYITRTVLLIPSRTLDRAVVRSSAQAAAREEKERAHRRGSAAMVSVGFFSVSASAASAQFGKQHTI
jgi:hypothetical protein